MHVATPEEARFQRRAACFFHSLALLSVVMAGVQALFQLDFADTYLLWQSAIGCWAFADASYRNVSFGFRSQLLLIGLPTLFAVVYIFRSRGRAGWRLIGKLFAFCVLYAGLMLAVEFLGLISSDT